jgi:uncharacterized membrane protein
MERTVRPRRSYSSARFHIEIGTYLDWSYTMNIFYIIGVVVVIIFVASFLGLHA